MTEATQPAMQAVLFDLDGTLLDSAPDLSAAAQRMLAQRGLPSLPLQRYRPMVSSGARGMIQVAFGVGPTHPDFEPMRKEFLGYYEQALLVDSVLFDGVTELLNELAARGMPWGVVTNKIERFTHPIVSQLAGFDAAATVVCGDTTAHPKPHPAPLLEAAKRMGVAPNACCYVGDDERDVQAGQAAGMATVAVRYGYLGEAQGRFPWGADHAIDAPTDLLSVLKK